MSIWVLVVYGLNSQQPPPILPGSDQHVVAEHEYKTRDLCQQAKQQQEHEDAEKGAAQRYSYKCVERKSD